MARNFESREDKIYFMNENIDNLSKNEYIAKKYTIRITHKAQKNLETMPKREQERFFRLKMGCMLEK